MPRFGRSEHQPLYGGLEIVGRQVRIDLRGLDVGVAEKFLDPKASIFHGVDESLGTGEMMVCKKTVCSKVLRNV
jgi:hypothetical protein